MFSPHMHKPTKIIYSFDTPVCFTLNIYSSGPEGINFASLIFNYRQVLHAPVPVPGQVARRMYEYWHKEVVVLSYNTVILLLFTLLVPYSL